MLWMCVHESDDFPPALPGRVARDFHFRMRDFKCVRLTRMIRKSEQMLLAEFVNRAKSANLRRTSGALPDHDLAKRSMIQH